MFKEYKNNYRVINNLDDKDKSLKNIKYHNKHKIPTQVYMGNLERSISFKEIESKIKAVPKKPPKIL